jgi:hypothetical protein
MIIGTHVLLYSNNADADRAFLRDTLGFKGIDVGGGWLIMKLPPAEIGVHPTEEKPSAEIYLICDDMDNTLTELQAKGIACSPIQTAAWGKMTMISMPSGAKLGMYEPRHEIAIDL